MRASPQPGVPPLHPVLTRLSAAIQQSLFRLPFEFLPNKFLVIAQYEDDSYLNIFLDNGIYTTIQIESGQVVEVLLNNTKSATF